MLHEDDETAHGLGLQVPEERQSATDACEHALRGEHLAGEGVVLVLHERVAAAVLQLVSQHDLEDAEAHCRQVRSPANNLIRKTQNRRAVEVSDRKTRAKPVEAGWTVESSG